MGHGPMSIRRIKNAIEITNLTDHIYLALSERASCWFSHKLALAFTACDKGDEGMGLSTQPHYARSFRFCRLLILQLSTFAEW